MLCLPVILHTHMGQTVAVGSTHVGQMGHMGQTLAVGSTHVGQMGHMGQTVAVGISYRIQAC